MMSPRPLSVVLEDKGLSPGLLPRPDAAAIAPTALDVAPLVRVGTPPTSRTAPVPEMLTKGIVRLTSPSRKILLIVKGA